MRHVITLAISLCFGICAPTAQPGWRPTMHYGDCLDLDHLPVGGVLEDRRTHLIGREKTVWPCGSSAR